MDFPITKVVFFHSHAAVYQWILSSLTLENRPSVPGGAALFTARTRRRLRDIHQLAAGNSLSEVGTENLPGASKARTEVTKSGSMVQWLLDVARL